ncbi:MAG: AAA family ATPase [Chloroflexota bacterium]
MQIIEQNYTQDYIKRALEEHQIEPPDNALANGTYEALIGLYLAHQNGGVAGAKTAWETLKKLRPELGIFGESDFLIHANKLRELPSPVHMTTKYPLYEGGFNVLFGPSGAGKSFIALDIASNIACNSPVIYIAGEGLHGYAARWEAWKVHNSIQTAELYFYKEALQVLDDADLLRFVNIIRAKQPSLVIIDTMARSAVGMDENSSKEVGVFIQRVDHIRFELGCSTLVVHHTGKSGHMRGSSSLYGAADSVISVSKNDGVIKLTNNSDFEGKNKYGPEDWNLFYRLLPVEADGYEGAVLVETEQIIDDLSIEGNELSDSQEEILHIINDYNDGTTAVTIVRTSDIPQTSVYRNLKKLIKADYITHDGKLYLITDEGKRALGVHDGS